MISGGVILESEMPVRGFRQVEACNGAHHVVWGGLRFGSARKQSLCSVRNDKNVSGVYESYVLIRFSSQ